MAELKNLGQDLKGLLFVERIMVGALVGSCVSLLLGAVRENDSEILLSVLCLLATLIAGAYNDALIRGVKEQLGRKK